MKEVVTRCGANVRRMRVTRDISLSELSRRSGVAKGTLSRLESGVGNPTVETLWAIATALDVPYDALFAQPGDEVFVARADEVATLRVQGAVAQIVDRVFGREVTDLAHLVYLAGTVREAVPDSPGTATRAFIVSGRVDLRLPSETIALGPHDFVRYASDVPHQWAPRGRHDVHALMLVTFGNQAWRAGGEDPLQDALRRAEATEE